MDSSETTVLENYLPVTNMEVLSNRESASSDIDATSTVLENTILEVEKLLDDEVELRDLMDILSDNEIHYKQDCLKSNSPHEENCETLGIPTIYISSSDESETEICNDVFYHPQNKTSAFVKENSFSDKKDFKKGFHGRISPHGVNETVDNPIIDIPSSEEEPEVEKCGRVIQDPQTEFSACVKLNSSSGGVGRNKSPYEVSTADLAYFGVTNVFSSYLDYNSNRSPTHETSTESSFSSHSIADDTDEPMLGEGITSNTSLHEELKLSRDNVVSPVDSSPLKKTPMCDENGNLLSFLLDACPDVLTPSPNTENLLLTEVNDVVESDVEQIASDKVNVLKPKIAFEDVKESIVEAKGLLPSPPPFQVFDKEVEKSSDVVVLPAFISEPALEINKIVKGRVTETEEFLPSQWPPEVVSSEREESCNVLVVGSPSSFSEKSFGTYENVDGLVKETEEYQPSPPPCQVLDTEGEKSREVVMTVLPARFSEESLGMNEESVKPKILPASLESPVDLAFSVSPSNLFSDLNDSSKCSALSSQCFHEDVFYFGQENESRIPVVFGGVPSNYSKDLPDSKASQKVPSWAVPWVSTDEAENADNNDPEWELLNKLKTDEERYRVVRKQWRQLEIPDPRKDLTRHNYRKTLLQDTNNNFVWTDDKVSRKRKRSHDPEADEHPCKKIRLISCTQMFNHKIENLHQQLDGDLQKLQADHHKAMVDLSNRQQEEHDRYYYSSTPVHAYRQQMRSLYRRQQRQVDELNSRFDEKRFNLSKEKTSAITKLEKVRKEVLTFNKFYNNLENADDNHCEITEDELKQVQETESMYELYHKLYSQ